MDMAPAMTLNEDVPLRAEQHEGDGADAEAAARS